MHIFQHWPRHHPETPDVLGMLCRDPIPENERGSAGRDVPNSVIVWDNVSFHQANVIKEWVAVHRGMLTRFLPPCAPLLKPNQDLFFHTEKEAAVDQPANHSSP
ncbi:unnamed protein product [Pleuronectes platessa]|uniref:Tc1-like transposase DDE domain-containing protein n=1 Tax=Pleuronectes platessa TaxID=8262 RepID=A0A9N7VBI0_PLEPL|nr:unnamed protein product [Pleuronectes platessa]